MNIRSYVAEKDLPMLMEWWGKHGVLPVPPALLPQGFIAEEGGNDYAACFLYLDVSGKCAMVEYLTTNPDFSFSRKSLAAFKALLFHVEHLTLAQGCGAIISMVAPGSSEERIMKKLGYITSSGPSHRMYGKVLVEQEASCQ